MAFPTLALEPLVHRPRNPLVEAPEELAHEQGRDDFVRLLLYLPVVTEAGVPDPTGDVSRPVETPQAFEDLPMGGISDSGDDLLQLAVEKCVVGWDRS